MLSMLYQLWHHVDLSHFDMNCLIRDETCFDQIKCSAKARRCCIIKLPFTLSNDADGDVAFEEDKNGKMRKAASFTLAG